MFRTIAAGRPQSLAVNARLFANLYFAGADALITAWDEKAERVFWRPITAIREADTDGNQATTADPNWLPLIPTPAYPDHPSGLTSLSGAFVATLQASYGTDDVTWSDTNAAGLTRSFTRFSQAVDETIDARVWSGIHFLRADEHGALIGTQVADWANANFFRPVSD
jgi:PAP2 superfamily